MYALAGLIAALIVAPATPWIKAVRPIEEQAPSSVTLTAQWDQTAGTLAEARGYVYRYYVDGAAAGAVLAPVTCDEFPNPSIPPTTFACYAPFTMTVAGPHTLTVSVELTTGERSAQSTPPAAFTVDTIGAPRPPESVVPHRETCPYPPWCGR